MIRIHRIYSSVAPDDRLRIEQVQTIFRSNFAYVQDYADQIPDLLDRPFKHRSRAMLLVSETTGRRVTGFSLFLHFPEINSSFLDFIAAASGHQGGGVGGALFEATREQLQALGSRGLYLEALPDDPALVASAEALAQNRRTLRFYERYGVRPIVGTEYDRATRGLQAGYLLFDGLGRSEPLGRDEARAAVRLIIRRQHGQAVSTGYAERVAASFVDDPVRMRPPRYVQPEAMRPAVEHGRLEKSFALVVSEEHAVHLVHQRGYVERPARVKAVMETLGPSGLFALVKPRHFGEGAIRAVHEGHFVNYLKAVCDKLPDQGPIYPYVFPIRRPERRPKDLAVRAGYYCIDTFTPIDRNAYRAARVAVDVALTAAQEVLGGRRVVYALCRPPGHHAGPRTFGGFCYFNNAAIAAHRLSQWGKVATLDLDYHHGNGTQDIFYRRDDVLTLSIHGHPNIAYPHFTGFAEERGADAGVGFNRNFPLPEGAGEQAYLDAVAKAVSRIQRFRPAFLVVSLGLDMLRGDPTGSFRVPVSTLRSVGRRLGALGLPLLVVQEGGYALRNLRRGGLAFFNGLAQGVAQATISLPDTPR
jgi:acetoin utilization deacetylase AcuC-like enzyme/GNAT superfamily N-acetyltransferase